MTHPLADARALFSYPDYRRTWAIGALTGGARWLEFVAVAIFVFELTRSPELVALLAVLRMLPYVLCGPVMGGLTDVLDRRWLLEVSLAAMVVVTGVMVAATAAGVAGYGAVAIATVFSGIFWTVDMPARRRLMLDAIGPTRMAAGLGFDNSTMHASRAIGPLIGGLTYEFVGISGIYALIMVCHAVCWVVARRISPGSEAAAGAPGRLDIRKFLPPMELIRDRRIQIAMGVTLVYNLWCFPFATMVPVIAQNDFQLSHAMVGALAACDGIGGTIGAILIGAVMKQNTLFRFYYFGTLVFLLLIGVLSMVLVVSVAVPVLILIGIAAASFSATQYALVYVLSPPEMRGRATGLLSLFIGSSLIGHYHAGFLFERIGSAAAMKVMAAEGLVAMAGLGLLWWRYARGKSSIGG